MDDKGFYFNTTPRFNDDDQCTPGPGTYKVRLIASNIKFFSNNNNNNDNYGVVKMYDKNNCLYRYFY